MAKAKAKEDNVTEEDTYMAPRRSVFEGSVVRTKQINYPVYYYKENDLATAYGYSFNPEDAIAKAGPGVTKELERTMSTCRLLTEFSYTNWTESIMPLRDSNLAEGLSEAVVMIANVAANGPKALKHDDLYLTIQFLFTLRDDNGEVPPNVLHFIEHVDYITKDDGGEQNTEALRE
ncbi:uncharacterized protein isoform X2 [Rhodnius prolixus]